LHITKKSQKQSGEKLKIVKARLINKYVCNKMCLSSYDKICMSINVHCISPLPLKVFFFIYFLLM